MQCYALSSIDINTTVVRKEKCAVPECHREWVSDGQISLWILYFPYPLCREHACVRYQPIPGRCDVCHLTVSIAVPGSGWLIFRKISSDLLPRQTEARMHACSVCLASCRAFIMVARRARLPREIIEIILFLAMQRLQRDNRDRTHGTVH